MDQALTSRRPFWRFSLRELLLLMLAAGAFIGWGVLHYERSQRFAPSKLFDYGPFWREDIESALAEIDEPPSTVTPFATTYANGPSVHHSESYSLPLTAANEPAILQKFRGRVRQTLTTAGCKISGEAAGSSGRSQVSVLSYRLDNRVGAVHICTFNNDDDHLRIVVTMHEEGAWKGGFGVGVTAGS